MLIVTIAALVMAASLGWFAYRLLRDEQRRADARVALLTAAIDGDDTSDWDQPVRAGHVGFATWMGIVLGTALKLAIAFAMIGAMIVALVLS